MEARVTAPLLTLPEPVKLIETESLTPASCVKPWSVSVCPEAARWKFGVSSFFWAGIMN
jgi:hypothetical protein